MVAEKPLNLKSFSNDIVETIGTLKTPVRSKNLKIQKAKITVVADGFRPILGHILRPISLVNWEQLFQKSPAKKLR